MSCATLSRVRTSVGQEVCRWVVFGVVIGEIIGTFVPIETELSLEFATSEPMYSHADHFDAACDDGVINKSNCGGVVCLYGRFGCGQPISASVLRMGTMSRAVM